MAATRVTPGTVADGVTARLGVLLGRAKLDADLVFLVGTTHLQANIFRLFFIATLC
jgi:hypothetical protein